MYQRSKGDPQKKKAGRLNGMVWQVCVSACRGEQGKKDTKGEATRRVNKVFSAGKAFLGRRANKEGDLVCVWPPWCRKKHTQQCFCFLPPHHSRYFRPTRTHTYQTHDTHPQGQGESRRHHRCCAHAIAVASRCHPPVKSTRRLNANLPPPARGRPAAASPPGSAGAGHAKATSLPLHSACAGGCRGERERLWQEWW